MCGPVWGRSGIVLGHGTVSLHSADGARQVSFGQNLTCYEAVGQEPPINQARRLFLREARCGGRPERRRGGSGVGPGGYGYESAMAEEEALAGGKTSGAVRIGDVIHKRPSPWTPTVHALLRHLEAAGVDGVPRVLGFDDQGREMLAYLPGETIGDRVPWPAWVFTDATLRQVGRWVRRVHDATAEFAPPAIERWFAGARMRPGLVVGHQDAAPYNAVMDGDRLVGFFGWDTAGPSSREFDLAFSALSWVPLYTPAAAAELGFHDVADRSRRLHLLLDAYGYDDDRRAFGTVITQRAWRQAGVIRAMADAGDLAAAGLLHVAGHLERSASDIEALPEDFWSR